MAKYIAATVLLALVLFSGPLSAQGIADSLIQSLENNQRMDTNRVDDLNEIARLIYRGYPDSSMVYSKEALRLSQHLDYTKGTAVANQRLAGAYFALRNTDSSMYYLEHSLEAFREIDDERGMASVNAGMGTLYAIRQDFEPAIERFLAAITEFEKLGNTSTVGIMYNNIGNLYLEQELFERALSNYEKALETIEVSGNRANLSLVYTNLANVYYELGRFDEALEFAEKGIANTLEFERYTQLPFLYTTVGNVYKEKGMYRESLENYKKALEYNSQGGNSANEAELRFFIASVSHELRENSEAKRSLTQALSLLENVEGFFNMKKDALHLMVLVENELGNYASAVNYSLKAMALADSLHKEEMALKISELETIYETEKKEAQIQLLETENEVANLRVFIIAGASFVVILLIILGFWYYHRRKAEQKRIKMELMKKELQQFGLVIAEKNKFISQFRGDLEEVRRHVSTLEGRKELASLVESIHDNVNLTEEEEELFNKIDQISTGFYTELRKKNDELTAHEERLATLVQMNLTNKEIASILSIEPDSVKQAKRRLKRKLQLEVDTNLQEYLKSMAV